MLTPNLPTVEGENRAAVSSAIKEYASIDSVKALLEEKGVNSLFLPVKRDDNIIPGRGMPLGWLKNGYPNNSGIWDSCSKGDYFVLQCGFQNGATAIEIDNWDIISKNGVNLKELSTCFSLEGIGTDLEPFKKSLFLRPWEFRTFWFGIQTEQFWDGDSFSFSLILKGASHFSDSLDLEIGFTSSSSRGDRDSRNLSRLRWLNSNIGDIDRVNAPFIPVAFNNNRVDILGRSIVIKEGALPSKIESYFNKNNSEILKNGENILASPLSLQAVTSDGIISPNGVVTKLNQFNKSVSWLSKSKGWSVRGRAEFDGFNEFKCDFKANKELTLKEIALSFRLKPEFSKYVMGMNLQGGFAPDDYVWKWDISKHQDAIWIGGVNGGLMIRLKGANYERPLVNAYYDFKKLHLPKSWGNDGKGSVTLHRESDGSLTFKATSGELLMNNGDELAFNFDLYITPFKPLDFEKQWHDRYYHMTPGSVANMPDIKNAKKVGANVINIHHNREFNPFINYPYNDYTVDELHGFVEQAHNEDMKVKVYYTTREITNNMAELFMLYSLDGEIISPRASDLPWPVTNSSGPHPWLSENLGDNFIPAWRESLRGRFKGMLDLAVITTPDSRWNNFYLEGLNYLIDRSEIDGLYIDDTALDRKSMQRAREILDSKRDGARVDMHSWNHFNSLAGWSNCSIVFMELYPYYDKLWHGEGFDYENSSPEYWLVEMSGIPFGLMSEMLQGGGNQYRGLLFGETNRKGWFGGAVGHPENIWSLFDGFGMEGSTLIGWWDKNSPVKSSNKDVQCSVYKSDGKAMVVLASWADSKRTVSIDIDWEAIGLDSNGVTISQPAIKGFQSGKKSVSLGNITIKPRKGVVFIIE